MPYCFPEGNEATVGSDTRRSWIKMADIGAGSVTPTVTASFSVIGTDIIVAGVSGVTIRLTLSGVRGVDTDFALSADNAEALFSVNPATITAGNLTVDIEVTANNFANPANFSVSATSDITVTNTADLELQAAPSVLFLDETGLGSAAGAWSVPRKLRSAYAGSCIRVRRSSDSTEQDIGFVSNELDEASLTTFCAATDGFVVTVYDQSGGANNLTQATASLQPKIVTSGTIITGANGKACARFDGSDDKLADTLTLNQPTTGFHIFAQQAWVSGDGIFGGGGGITQSLLQTGSSPIFAMYAGSAGANITGFSLSTWNLGTFIFNGASSTWSRNDGADTTVNPNTGNSSGFTWGSRSQTDASCAQVDFQETVIYTSVKNTTDRDTAEANMNAFYSLWP